MKELLEQALIARTKDLSEKTTEELESEFNINFEISDLPTIHESYQFLYKKYVEDADSYKNENFLDMEEIKANNEKRKKKKKKKSKDKMDDMDVEDIEPAQQGRRSR